MKKNPRVDTHTNKIINLILR